MVKRMTNANTESNVASNKAKLPQAEEVQKPEPKKSYTYATTDRPSSNILLLKCLTGQTVASNTPPEVPKVKNNFRRGRIWA